MMKLTRSTKLVAFEAAVHSVHHVGHLGAAGCVIASTSAHGGALVVERVALEQPARVAIALIGDIDTGTAVRVSSPVRGRAPPAV